MPASPVVTRLVSIPLDLASLVLGILRTLGGLVRSLVTHKPIRVDLPVPGLPVDVVLVSKPNQIQAILKSPACGRLHALPTSQLPHWASLYFSATRFHDDRSDKWFVPFEPASESSHSATRKATIVTLLAKGYTQEDVHQVAGLLKGGAQVGDVAAYATNMVNSRFINNKTIPATIIGASRSALRGIGHALKPGSYKSAKAAVHQVVDFTTDSIELPPAELQPLDVAHNIGATSVAFANAIMTLKANPATPVSELFTIAKNAPTPNIPRVALEASTFGGLLSYPSVPNKTIFIMNIAKAAAATKSHEDGMFYTMGSGTRERSCAFKPFFETFMADLQRELAPGASAVGNKKD